MRLEKLLEPLVGQLLFLEEITSLLELILANSVVMQSNANLPVEESHRQVIGADFRLHGLEPVGVGFRLLKAVSFESQALLSLDKLVSLLYEELDLL